MQQKPKFAIIGDIHGNWEALNAVLEDAGKRDVTHYACVGDIVGYNADPELCVDRIMELECVTVRGNHDHFCVHDECLRSFHSLAADVMKWTRGRLDERQIDFLRHLRISRSVNGFLMVHSTLDMPERWGYVFDEFEAESHFAYQNTALCFHGHTHTPLVFEKGATVRCLPADRTRIAQGRKYFVNVGSVGQPRDGNPDASYAVYDASARTIEFYRVPYDVAAAQEKIRRAGLPERLAARLAIGR